MQCKGHGNNVIVAIAQAEPDFPDAPLPRSSQCFTMQLFRIILAIPFQQEVT